MANMKLQSKFGANRQKWPRYCSLCVSKTAAVRHLEFYRKLDSGPQSHSYGQCQQPAYQILRKYLYCWPRYGRKTKFKTAAAAILNFQRMLFGPQVSLVWPMCIRRAHLVQSAKKWPRHTYLWYKSSSGDTRGPAQASRASLTLA